MTLTELLVAIAVIGIVGVWASMLNFRSLNDKQYLEIFSNKVISEIETLRTNALVGRGVADNSGNLITPEARRFVISETWVTTSYMLESSDWEPFSTLSMQDWSRTFTLKGLGCENSKSENLPLSWKDWEIIFRWDKYSFTWACISGTEFYYNKLNITLSYGDLTEELSFDTISWLVERIDD